VSTNAGFTTLVYDQVLTVTSAAPTNLTPGNTYYWRAGAGNFVGETVSASRSFTVQASPWIALTKSSYVGGDNKIHPRLNWTHDGQGTSPIFYIYRYSCPNPPGTDCGTWPYPFMAATTATTYDDPSADVAQKGQTPDVTYYYEVRSAGISNKVSYNGVTGPTKELVVDPLLPKVTALHQNYPNPFNPTTTVKYDLAFDSRVRIVLYDLLGQEIATLVDEEQTAGFKEFIFDGNTLPSGVYFFRMTAGEFMRVRKMALVR
jgi:hypothetical protein